MAGTTGKAIKIQGIVVGIVLAGVLRKLPNRSETPSHGRLWQAWLLYSIVGRRATQRQTIVARHLVPIGYGKLTDPSSGWTDGTLRAGIQS